MSRCLYYFNTLSSADHKTMFSREVTHFTLFISVLSQGPKRHTTYAHWYLIRASAWGPSFSWPEAHPCRTNHRPLWVSNMHTWTREILTENLHQDFTIIFAPKINFTLTTIFSKYFLKHPLLCLVHMNIHRIKSLCMRKVEFLNRNTVPCLKIDLILFLFRILRDILWVMKRTLILATPIALRGMYSRILLPNVNGHFTAFHRKHECLSAVHSEFLHYEQALKRHHGCWVMGHAFKPETKKS